MVKQFKQIIFKFLWNGTDKVTRGSTINEYSEGGLKMIDLECMVKSLRLAWLKRIFNNNDGIWKTYLRHKLQPFGGFFFMNCNYDIKDYLISSQFYHEFLLWWSEFRETFASEKDWENIIWNNRDIRIDKKPVFYKNYFDSGVVYTHNLLLDLDNGQSYSKFSKTIRKSNFLQWAGLRHSIPPHLKDINKSPSITSPGGYQFWKKRKQLFHVTKRHRSKHWIAFHNNFLCSQIQDDEQVGGK